MKNSNFKSALPLLKRWRPGVRAVVGFALLSVGVGPACVGCRPLSPATNPTPVKVARPPYDPNRTELAIRCFAERTRRDPQDWLSPSLLAGYYLDRCRETGDIGDAVRAEQTARRSLARFGAANMGARSQLAMSLLTQHRFSEALAALGPARTLQAVGFNTASPQTHSLRAEIAMEMGDYAEAERVLQEAAGPISPNGIALRARMLEIDGQPLRALDYLRRAQDEADRNSDMPLPSVAWFHMRTGNLLADLGRIAEAEQAYREALAIFPRDYRTLTSLARLAAGRGDWQAVLDWGGRSAAIVPMPDVVALLGDAYTALGRRREAETQYALVDIIAKLAKAQGGIYDRQRALFCADHERNLDEALTLAKRELQVRHDIYAYDTLAWVCCRKGMLKEAHTAMEKALARGTQDARLFYHAGMLAYAEGDRAQARDYLSRALKLNPYFLPFAPQQAQALLAQLDRS